MAKLIFGMELPFAAKSIKTQEIGLLLKTEQSDFHHIDAFTPLSTGNSRKLQ